MLDNSQQFSIGFKEFLSTFYSNLCSNLAQLKKNFGIQEQQTLSKPQTIKKSEQFDFSAGSGDFLSDRVNTQLTPADDFSQFDFH